MIELRFAPDGDDHRPRRLVGQVTPVDASRRTAAWISEHEHPPPRGYVEVPPAA
ncbi:MAG TPA: hypothetical protein VHK88_10020 [Aquihabitans sp.]|nr:hypothetical protein [Aquihabitans sp.]